MTTQDIVASATTTAAQWLDLADRGSIVEGRAADLVGVPRAALDDPALLTDVRLVVHDGRRVPARG
jgi:imidazolonepropionase-like amidohydrolase